MHINLKWRSDNISNKGESLTKKIFSVLTQHENAGIITYLIQNLVLFSKKSLISLSYLNS